MTNDSINVQADLSEDELMAQQASQAAMNDTEDVLVGSSVDSVQTDGTLSQAAPVDGVVSSSQDVSEGQTEEPIETQEEGSSINSLTQMASELTDGLSDGSVDTGTSGESQEVSAGDRLSGMVLTGAEATLIGTIGSKLTGNKLIGTVIGIGGTLALQKMDKLPDSMEDVKNLIGKVTQFFTGDGKSYIVEDAGVNSQQTDTSILNQTMDGFQTSTGTVVSGIGQDGVSDISESMYQNGASMASSGTFQLAATMDDSSQSALRSLSEENMTQLKEQVAGLVGEDGTISEENKADVVAEMKALYDGYSSYAEGAVNTLGETYGVDSEEYQTGIAGLSNVMQQETSPFYETIHELDNQYGLFSEEDLAYFQSKQIEGMPSYEMSETNSALTDETETLDAIDGTEVSDTSQLFQQEESQSHVEIPSYFEDMTANAEAQTDVGMEMS